MPHQTYLAVNVKHFSTSNSSRGSGVGPTLRANPYPEVTDLFGRLPSLIYIVLLTKGCAPWRPEAVMSTTKGTNKSRHRVFTDRRERTGQRKNGMVPTAVIAVSSSSLPWRLAISISITAQIPTELTVLSRRSLEHTTCPKTSLVNCPVQTTERNDMSQPPDMRPISTKVKTLGGRS
eukprot:gene2509-4879_t